MYRFGEAKEQQKEGVSWRQEAHGFEARFLVPQVPLDQLYCRFLRTIQLVRAAIPPSMLPSCSLSLAWLGRLGRRQDRILSLPPP